MTDFLRPALHWLRTTRCVSRTGLVVFLGLNTGLLFVFRTTAFQTMVTQPVADWTGGLVTHVLLANLIAGAVLVGGLLVTVEGLRWRDVGLQFGWRGAWQVLNAVLITYLLWAAVQLVLALYGWGRPGAFSHNPAWIGFTQEYRTTLASSMSAFFGSALVEEIKYRGVLLPQLFLLTTGLPLSANGRLWLALAGSQLVFGLHHVPVGLDSGLHGELLVLYVTQVAAVGLVFALLYLRTGNLYVAVGVHALVNDPVPMYLTSIDPRLVALTLVIGLLMIWPWLASFFRHVFAIDRIRALGRLRRRQSGSSRNP